MFDEDKAAAFESWERFFEENEELIRYLMGHNVSRDCACQLVMLNNMMWLFDGIAPPDTPSEDWKNG